MRNAALELHKHSKPKECGATFHLDSSQNRLARIVHKGRSPQKMCVNWRLTFVFRGEARERCSNVNSFTLRLLRDWWKGNPVLDGCESGNTVVHCPCLSRSTKEMQSGHEVF